MAPGSSAVSEFAGEKRKLKKALFGFDMIFFTVCAIVALDTLGQSSSYGAQAIFWLIVSAITFLVPYGLLTAELGTAFPSEGATYEWVRLAYGHLAGSVTAILYWLSNPIWLGGTLAATTIATMDAFWGTKIVGNTVLEIIIGLAFIWVAVVMNVLSLKSMKWVPNWGAFLKIALLVLFAVLVVVLGVQHGFKGSITSGFFPTNLLVFVGVLGVLVFQWVGFETQTNASEEMDNPQRDVPRAVAAAGVISTLGYAIPIIGIVLVLSGKDLSGVSGFVTGFQTVAASAFGGGAGVFSFIVGAAVIFTLLASGTTWLMGSDRMMAIGALAGSGPRSLGHFSERWGTPITVNIISGVIATIFMVVNFAVTSGNLASFFAVVLALVISTTTFSYVLVFPALITLRSKYPNLRRPYRVPGGMAGAWITMLLCEFWVVAATVFSLWPNLCDTSSCFGASAVADVGKVSRFGFEATALGTIAVLLVLAVVFYLLGRPHAIFTGPEDVGPSGAAPMPMGASGE
jgi:amino acid transporter